MLGALGDWQAAVKVYGEVAEAAQKLPVRKQFSYLCSHEYLLATYRLMLVWMRNRVILESNVAC